MLKITFGLWNNDNSISGNFIIFGKKFLVFMEPVENPKPNWPHYSVTIMEAKNATQSGN